MNSYDITHEELIQMEQEHYASHASEQQPPFSPEQDAEFLAYMEELADAPVLDGTEELFADETLEEMFEDVNDWAPWVAPMSPVYSDSSSHGGAQRAVIQDNYPQKLKPKFNCQ